MKKKILYIGNRANALNVILSDNDLKVFKVFALKDSYLEKETCSHNIETEVFTLSEKDEVLKKIQQLSFDILISNGCPFILPVSKIKKDNQLFINVHPTYLPFLKGKTGINGVFYNEMSFFGATVHYIDDGIDTGNIIWQEKENLTQDIDLGLLYFLSFELEKRATDYAFRLLKEKNWNYAGIIQNEQGTTFNRDEKMKVVDFTVMKNSEILRIIKSFGIVNQGAVSSIENKTIYIYEAEEIFNPLLLSLFSKNVIGSIVLHYDNKLIIKTIDGLIKLKSYDWSY